MKEYKKVNLVFLLSVLVPELLSFTGILSFIPRGIYRQMIANVLFAAPAICYLAFSRRSFAPVIGLRKIKVGDVFLCLLAYICLYPVLTFANAISMLYSDNIVAGTISTVAGDTPFLLGLFVLAIMPAFFEEMTYRGVMYNGYKDRNPRAAILVSALLFALMHGNLNQFTYAFVLGLIFCLFVEATGSILSTMILHFLVNGFSTVLMYAIPRALEYIRDLYEEAKAANDVMTMQLLESAYGGDISGLTLDSLLAGSTELSTVDKFVQIRAWIFPALVGAALAFVIIKKIAKRNNTTDRLKRIFSAKVESTVTEEPYEVRITREDIEAADATMVTGAGDDGGVPEEQLLVAAIAHAEESRDKGHSLVSWELVAGIVITVVDIVLYELAVRGIIGF